MNLSSDSQGVRRIPWAQGAASGSIEALVSCANGNGPRNSTRPLHDIPTNRSGEARYEARKTQAIGARWRRIGMTSQILTAVISQRDWSWTRRSCRCRADHLIYARPARGGGGVVSK